MKFTLLFLLGLLPAAAAAGQPALQTPAGPDSLAPALSPLPDGGAVLSWLEAAEAGHRLMFAEFAHGRFEAPREIARGQDWFANWADTPALHVLPGGDWVAHWLEKSGPATFAYDIRVVRSSDRGRTWSEPVTPHRDGTRTEHGFVSYFDGCGSDAGLVWLDGRETDGGAHDHGEAGHGAHPSGDMQLRAACLGPDGAVSGKAVLDPRVCDCCQTAAAMTDSGPVVIYRGRSEDEIRDILIVRGTGPEWSPPRPVHEDGWQIAGCPVNGPALIGRGSELVAAWFTMPGGVPQVRLARSTDAGAHFGEPLVLGRETALGRVQLAWLEDGFLLLWMDQEASGAVLRLARFGAGREPVQVIELAGLDGGRSSGFPRMQPVAGGRLLVAWTASEDRRPRVRTTLIDLTASNPSP